MSGKEPFDARQMRAIDERVDQYLRNQTDWPKYAEPGTIDVASLRGPGSAGYANPVVSFQNETGAWKNAVDFSDIPEIPENPFPDGSQYDQLTWIDGAWVPSDRLIHATAEGATSAYSTGWGYGNTNAVAGEIFGVVMTSSGAVASTLWMFRKRKTGSTRRFDFVGGAPLIHQDVAPAYNNYNPSSLTVNTNSASNVSGFFAQGEVTVKAAGLARTVVASLVVDGSTTVGKSTIEIAAGKTETIHVSGAFSAGDDFQIKLNIAASPTAYDIEPKRSILSIIPTYVDNS